MSFLRGKQPSTQQPTYTSVPIQTSVSTLPVAVGWGTAMTAGNLIWYGDFNKTTKSSSGGKGLTAGGKGGGTVDYTCSLMLALCEGLISIVKIAKDGTSWQQLSDTGFGLIGGTVPQTAWAYVATAYPAESLSYPGTAMMVSEHWDLGGSPQLPSQNVVLHLPLAGSATWASTGEYQTADLALVIQDFLTNARYGVQDFPASAINTATLLSSGAATTTGDATLQTYCRAMGFGFSPFLGSVESGLSILGRWLAISNCEAVWSGSALKFVPYGDTAVAANGVTYLPNLTPIYDFTDDDYVGDASEDPVQISRVDPADVPNVLRLEVTTNDGFYSAYPVEARDQASIEAIGSERVGSSVTAHEIIGAAQGNVIANLLLQRGLNVRNTYTWKADWTKCLLEPMDLVTLTDPNLGLARTVVRITEIAEDENCILTFTAEDFPQGIAGPTAYPAQSTISHVMNTTTTADPINPPVIFEPPAALTTNGENEVWIALSGGIGGVADPYWGGADIYVSTDNVTYEKVGTASAAARQGTLTAALPAFSGTNPDAADTLTVNLTESAGALVSTTALNASLGTTLCFCDGELLAFTTATLTGAFTYALTGLYRGMNGTAAAAHASGSLFARLDSAVFKYVPPPQFIGVPLWFKAVSFNIWGQGYQGLSAVTAYTHTPAGNSDFSGVAFMEALAIGNNVALGDLSTPFYQGYSLGQLGTPFGQAIVLGTL